MRRDKIFAEAVANIHTLQSPGYGVSMDDESRKIPTAAEIFYNSLKTWQGNQSEIAKWRYRNNDSKKLVVRELEKEVFRRTNVKRLYN